MSRHHELSSIELKTVMEVGFVQGMDVPNRLPEEMYNKLMEAGYVDVDANEAVAFKTEKWLVVSKLFNTTIEVTMSGRRFPLMIRIKTIEVKQSSDLQEIRSLRDNRTMRVPGNLGTTLKMEGLVQDSVARMFMKMNMEQKMPRSVQMNQRGDLHSTTGPALLWIDGEPEYYVNGVNVPKKVIENPFSITKDEFNEIQNAEVRRIIVEQIGNEKFIKLLDLEVEDLKMINGEEYTLMKTRRVDPVVRDYLKYVRVIDTSTGRMYYLQVPPHIEDAHTAVAWTFNKSKNDYKPEIEA